MSDNKESGRAHIKAYLTGIMSSVAVQPIPAQSQTLASPSNRQYSTTQDAQSPYYSQHSSNHSSHDYARRQSRRSSYKNGAISSSQPSPYHNSAASAHQIDTRDVLPVTGSTSFAPRTDIASPNNLGATQQPLTAPIAPPRSSSYSDRSTAQHAPRDTGIDQRLEDTERRNMAQYERREADRYTNGGSGSSVLPVRPAPRDTRNPLDHDIQHRVAREPSAVLNRVVVSQPEEDLIREQERIAESAQTTIPARHIHESDADQEAPARGARSRQDYSTSKKEKNTKFGDYFLGNTLGEGEFGKVKMGWKQEGGVQVSIYRIYTSIPNSDSGRHQAHKKRQRG